MDNQASDDELRDAILTEFKQVYKLAGSGDYTENCTNVVMSIVRTEKQKLLAEVRERVVGEDLPLNTTPDTGQRIYNKVKANERTALTKLEAEL